MRKIICFIAAGVTGAFCAATPARGAASAKADVPAITARDSMPPLAPPALLAQTAVPLTPVVAVQPAPAVAASVVAPRSIVRAITPNGSQPGVLWIIAIGALLCRLGARVVRAS